MSSEYTLHDIVFTESCIIPNCFFIFPDDTDYLIRDFIKLEITQHYQLKQFRILRYIIGQSGGLHSVTYEFCTDSSAEPYIVQEKFGPKYINAETLISVKGPKFQLKKGGLVSVAEESLSSSSTTALTASGGSPIVKAKNRTPNVQISKKLKDRTDQIQEELKRQQQEIELRQIAAFTEAI